MTSTDTRPEQLADACIHVIGIVTGLVAVSLMIVSAVQMLPGSAITALAIYGTTLLAMLVCSAAYNMNRLPRLSSLLRRFDHAAIFVKIAGTYTPFTIVKMGGFVGYGLLGVVWAIAVAGVTAKLVFNIGASKFYVIIYLALGWAGIFVIGPVVAALPTDALVLLAAGAFFYTAGVLFHLWESLPYQNAIWHLFVLLGTACHFGAVVAAVLFD